VVASEKEHYLFGKGYSGYMERTSEIPV